jgi:3-dehydroquinate synthase
MINKIRIDLGERSYDILIGASLLAQAGALIKPVLKRPRVIIVTDEHLAGLHLPALRASLEAAGIVHSEIVLPPGEETKRFARLESLIEALLDQKPDRNVTLVALGGGVIGDITGFAASILLRGVDFIQIPTTLLAQVDSSVGGKTGINTRHGKNLVGSFHQPRLVLADTSVLSTLPVREMRSGYAEVLKYGLIGDAGFFAWLEAHGAQALAGDASALAEAVEASCRAKARIVEEDEREAGKRALLNFGHTFGHALEAETGFSDRLSHGEAVALGMILALRLSVQRGLCPPEDLARVLRHYEKTRLPQAPGAFADFDPKALIGHFHQDKKAKDGRLTFILARGIGDAFIAEDVEEAELEALLAESLSLL